MIEYAQTWIEWLHYSLFTIGLEALYNNLFYIHVGIGKVPMSSIIDRSLTFFFFPLTVVVMSAFLSFLGGTDRQLRKLDQSTLLPVKF